MSESFKEATILEKANAQGGIKKVLIFSKISGPGIWLTLAALSAGSLIGSLGLGQWLGTEALWVQASAMLLGIFSLWAVSQISLNTQQSLFSLMKNEWNPSLAWWFAGSALVTNFAWCMPQFRFGAEITGSILFPPLDNKGGKIGVAFVLLCLSIFLSFWYERSGLHSKLFQWILRLILFSLIGCLGVSVCMLIPGSGLSFSSIFSGFLPDLNNLTNTSPRFEALLSQTGEFRSFWEENLVSRQKELILITFSSTLGVNLLFSLPLLLLGRGWRRDHNQFAKFNLFLGLFIPFVLCSSCLTILSAVAHQKMIHSLNEEVSVNTKYSESETIRNLLKERIIFEIGEEQFQSLPPFQQDEKIESLSKPNYILAHLVSQSDTKKWIHYLSDSGKEPVKYLLGIVVLLISFSTIVILMVLNGHLICEILGKPHKGAPFQTGSLLLAVSSIGPFVWSDQDAWVADPSYFLSLAIIPYILLSFLLMLNSKELLGRQYPQGIKGFSLNLGVCLSFLLLGSCSFYLVWNHTWGSFPIGQVLVTLIGILVLIGYFSLKNKKLAQRLKGLEVRLDRVDQLKNK
ncbi:MAG: hypothetical protein ACO2Z3_06500 [Flavobacteriaceae bacterium]